MSATISILARSGVTLTRACIDSVLRSTPPCQLILTANGDDAMLAYFNSVAGSRDQHGFDVVVHWNETNLGFQEPNKKALSVATGEFFVMLNNDAVVSGPWLETMLAQFGDPLVALVGTTRGCCSLDMKFHGYPGKRFEYVEGSLLACRSALVRECGLFSDYISFAYGEDSDLSLRMQRLGYKIARVNVDFKHIGQQTSANVPRIKEIQEANHQVLRRVWSHYLKVRKFDHPIIVKRTTAIGDVLLTTPIIKALHEQRPLSRIHVQTDHPEIFDRNPHVSLVSKQLTATHDTEIINLDMAYESRINTHIIDAYAAKAHVFDYDSRLIYTPSDSAIEWAGNQMAKSDNPKCVMFYGPTTWIGKNWPLERFEAIATWLMAQGWDVIQIGSGHKNEIKSTVDLRGKTSIDKSAALLRHAQLHVGLDSLPLHLAMSQGTPTVAIFGATLPEYILPEGFAIGVHADPGVVPCVGNRHRVVNSTHVDCNGACMRAVGTHSVKEAIEAVIGQAKFLGEGHTASPSAPAPASPTPSGGTQSHSLPPVSDSPLGYSGIDASIGAAFPLRGR
jgi:ADP-heptose:LPS heptosyltransferase